MTRDDIFDGLDVKPQPDRDVYEEGAETLEIKLARELADGVLELKEKFPYASDGFMNDLVDEILPSEFAALNTSVFLDAFITCFMHYRGHKGKGMCVTTTDRIIQRLYNEGMNDFSIDLTCWKDHSIMGKSLKGTRENPLQVHYRGKPWELGTFSSHCIFTLTGELKIAGQGATECDFYLETMDLRNLLQYVDSSDYYSYQSGNGDRNLFPVPNKCKYFVKEGIDVEELKQDKKVVKEWPSFAMGGNKLYIPDEQGEWMEVKL